MFRLHQRLVGLRRRHPWLHRARTTVISLTNERFAYVAGDADHALVVALNVSDEPFRVPLPDGGDELLEGQDAVLDDGVVMVGPHGWAVAG